MLQIRRFRFTFFIFITVFLLSACQGNKQNENSGTKEVKNDVSESQQNSGEQNSSEHKVAPLRKIKAANDPQIVRPTFLRENLPESVFAYVRIPNFWSFIGTAKGNVFDTALNAQPLVDAVTSIRSGLIENVIPEIPDVNAQFLVKLVTEHLTSPIEMIGIEGVDPAIPTPNVVITANVNFKSVDEIQKQLDLLAKLVPEIEITKAMQTDGYAELLIAKMNAQLQWDKEKSRFTLLAGISLSPNNLTDLIKTFTPNPTHQMKAIEKTIDTSGQGYFAWANPRKLTNIASSLGLQRELAPLAVIGISSMKNIALGSGTSDGINRLKYVVEMPVTGFRSYMPIINSTPNFDVMGKTKLVAVMGLPSRADFASIENTIALVSKSRDMESYYKMKKAFRKALGFEIDDIFEFFGQDVSFVSDEAGSYVAIRLNDAQKFKSALNKSVESFGLAYQQREIGGHTYHHLKIPSFYANYLEDEAKKNKQTENKFLNRFLNMPSHIYWEQEGDYLILSNIPQTLIDRHYVKTKTPVKEWLTKHQRINPDGSLMMISLNNEGTAEKMYRMHLSFLNYLADFTGKPIDLFALATPHEAKIPKASSYGFKITSSETQLAFELNYESNPFEFLLAGSAYESIAVIGILSAIAIPAYEDYTVRAKLINGMIASNEIKAQLNEFEIEYGRYPNEYEIADLKLNKVTPTYSIKVDENNGEINIKFTNRALKSRNSLKMIPPKQGVSTTWRCESRINKKYLSKSSACRTKY